MFRFTPLFRFAPSLLLVACSPTVAELHAPPADPPAPDGKCDATVEVDGDWTYATRDYGLPRGVDAFDPTSERFVQSGGAYSSTQRVFDVATGDVLSEVQQSSSRALVHHPASHTDLYFEGQQLQIVDSGTGELRASLPIPGRGWLTPSVSVDGETIAMLSCVNDDRSTLTTFDLQGRTLDTLALDLACSNYGIRPFGFHEASHTAIAATEDRAVVIDLQSANMTTLEPHQDDPEIRSGIGPMHDLWMHPMGNVVATAGSDGALMLHDLHTAEVLSTDEIRVVQVNRNIYVSPDTRSAFAWSTDGRLSARGVDDTIVIERVCDGVIVSTLDVDPELRPEFDDRDSAPAALYFSPNSRALVAVYEGGVQGFVLDVQ